MKKQKTGRVHYAWFILVACCALQGGTLGLIQNSCGIFYRPICDELGFDLGAITLYTTIRGLTSCAALPFATRILKTKDLRVTLSAAICVFATANMAMGACSQLWQWYAAGLIQGIASAFMAVVTVPIVLSNWFVDKRGFAIGFASAFSGVLGIVANPAGSALIEAAGWRVCYLVFGLISLICILPFTLFVFRFRPDEMGWKAYGCQPTAMHDETGAAPSAAMRPTLLLLVLLFVLEVTAMFSSSFTVHLASFGTDVGMQVTAAAALASLSMAGNMVGKLLLGTVSDRIGPGRATLASFLLPIAGFAMLLFGKALAYPASFLIGVAIPAAAVMMPLLIRSILGDCRFEEVYSMVTLFGSITYSLGGSVIGFMYDGGNGYGLAAVVCCAMMVLGTIGVLLLLKLPQRYLKKHV